MMRTAPSSLLSPIDRLLRTGEHTVVLTWRGLVLITLCLAPVYGLAMGSYSATSLERLWLAVFAAIKMPILLVVTATVCLPAFFVLNTVAGLRRDFPQALATVFAGQATIAVTLASLAPVTLVYYSTAPDHATAVLFNAAFFAVATAAGFVVAKRLYKPLIARDRRHLAMAVAWVTMYVFVGIQMGWMLRPFIGHPGLPASFLREGAFSNAYIVVARLIFG